MFLNNERRIVSTKIIVLTLVLSVFLSSCSFSTAENKIEITRTKEAITLFNEVGVLIGTLEYNDAIKQLEDNYDVVKDDDQLLATYAGLKSHIYGDYQKAEELITKAIEINPHEFEYHLGLGYIYQGQEKYLEAIESFEKAANNADTFEGQWNPDIAKAYKYIGDSYMAIKNAEDALMAYEKATTYNPYNIELNAKLHQLYVQKEKYNKAYDIWKTDNFVIEGQKNIYPQTDKWNELYDKVLNDNLEAKHLAFAELYDELVLYDEAKIEYEKALTENGQNKEIETRLYEINTYLAFRDDFKNSIENYYRDRSINGVRAHITFYQNLEPVYQKIAVLFPELEEKKSSIIVWIESLDKAIEEKFKVRIAHKKANGSMLGSHFGRIIDNSSIHSELWGEEIDLQVIVLKNMVTNGLDYWRTMESGGVGGWSGSTVQVVKVIQSSENDAMIDALFIYDEDFKKEIIEKAKQLNEEVTDRQPLDIYFLYELTNQFMIRQMEIELDKAMDKGIPDKEINTYIFNRLIKEYLIRSSIYVHESQHSIDNKTSYKVNWFGEYEYRAKLSQLAYADMRFIALSSFYSPTIETNEKNTHTRANKQVLHDIVQYIYDHSGQFPQIDTKQNILEQLPRLSEEDIQLIAIGIYESKYPESKF